LAAVLALEPSAKAAVLFGSYISSCIGMTRRIDEEAQVMGVESNLAKLSDMLTVPMFQAVENAIIYGDGDSHEYFRGNLENARKLTTRQVKLL
jgi:hypothetical protein